MRHTCQNQKTKAAQDFRKILRERATNHSHFYRQLSTPSTIKTLTQKPELNCHQMATINSGFNSINSTKGNETQSLKLLPSIQSLGNEFSESEECTGISKPALHLRNDADQTTINHQPTKLTVAPRIKFNNDGHSGERISSTGIIKVTSTISAEEELLNKHNKSNNKQHEEAQLSSFSMDIDKAYDSMTVCPALVSTIQVDPPPSLNDNATSSSLGGNKLFVNSAHSKCNGSLCISMPALADGGAAYNHFVDDNKSFVSFLSSSGEAQTTSVLLPALSSLASSVIATAINNNNKTCEQHDRNHSNYSTFVRATSTDHHLCSLSHQKNCERYFCRNNRCCADGKRDSGGKGNEAASFWNKNLNPGCETRAGVDQESLSLNGEEIVDKSFGESFSAEHGLRSLFENCKEISVEDESSECKILRCGLSYVPNGSKDILKLLALPSECNYSTSLHVEQTVQDINLKLNQTPVELNSQLKPLQQYYNFPCVDKLVKMYTKLLQDKKIEMKPSEAVTDNKSQIVSNSVESSVESDMKSIEGLKIKDDRVANMSRSSPFLDEGCQLASSPYSSDLDDTENEPASSSEERRRNEIVLQSSSSDSALDLDDEPPMEPPTIMNTGRRLTLTVTDIPLRAALLPVAEPHTLPDSSLSLDQTPSPPAVQTSIPSKVILEERIVEIPEDKFPFGSNSRRESAQSTLSDFNPIECGAVRFVRTPSVVVSDYSDDILCGVTLEEIEYFRQHRMRRRSSDRSEKDDAASDVSAASSCSNLDYCGSTISGLDGSEYFMNGEKIPIDRKISDCSTCSTVSGDDDDENGSGGYIDENQDELVQQNQQKEDVEKLRKDRKKIQVKARHPKFIK